MPQEDEPSPYEPPEWFAFSEEQAVEHFREHAVTCECCNARYLVRWCDNPQSAFGISVDESENVPTWFRINNLGTRRRAYREGDVMYNSVYITEYPFEVCDEPHPEESRFDNTGNSYERMCDSCYHGELEENSEQEEEQGSQFVHSYSYRPSVTFFDLVGGSVTSITSNNLLSELGKGGRLAPAAQTGRRNYVQRPVCGFELEMSDESGAMRYDRAARHLYQTCSDFSYLKEDGSVSNGFELVTHPHTLEAYQARPEMWGALELLRNNGWRSWSSDSSCGLHIHINNASFTTVGHAMRFLRFVYTNKEPLVRFAGRDSHYAKFNYDSFVQRQIHTGYGLDGNPIYETATVADLVKKKQVNDDRYLAVNAQNLNTYELRFFRGSMKPTTVLACLEFVFALHEYTDKMTSNDVLVHRALGWRAFLAFVRTKSGKDNFRYRNLLSRLAQANRNPDAGFLVSGDDNA